MCPREVLGSPVVTVHLSAVHLPQQTGLTLSLLFFSMSGRKSWGAGTCGKMLSLCLKGTEADGEMFLCKKCETSDLTIILKERCTHSHSWFDLPPETNKGHHHDYNHRPWNEGAGQDQRRVRVCVFTCARNSLTQLQLGHLADAFIQSDLHQLIHTLTHQRQSQPCKATASSSGAVRVKCLLRDTSTL